MVSRAFVQSRSNAALLRRAAGFLAGHPEHAEILVVAPTRAAAHELAIRAFPSGSQGIHALTLIQVARHLAAQPMGRLALAPLSRLGMEAIAARIVHAAATAKQLPYFAPVAQTPGFARALANTITELRLENVTPPGDLAHLLALYEQELDARSVADLPMLLRLAAQEAEATGRIVSPVSPWFCSASPSNPRLMSGSSPRWRNDLPASWRQPSQAMTPSHRSNAS